MEIQYNHFDVYDYTESDFYLEEAKLYRDEILQLLQRKNNEVNYLRNELNQTKEKLNQREAKPNQTKAKSN
jgi:arginine deiminase